MVLFFVHLIFAERDSTVALGALFCRLENIPIISSHIMLFTRAPPKLYKQLYIVSNVY